MQAHFLHVICKHHDTVISMQTSIKTFAVLLSGILIGIVIAFVSSYVGFSFPLTGQLVQPPPPPLDPLFIGIHASCRHVAEGECSGTAISEDSDDAAFWSSNMATACFAATQAANCNANDLINPTFDSTVGCDPGPATCYGPPLFKTCYKSCKWECKGVRKYCCGNQRTESPESCDAGSAMPTPSCAEDCRQVRCGDGIVDGGGSAPSNEECDPGSECDGPINNACTTDADCAFGTCAPKADNPYCTAACTLVVCGDGQTEGAEDCDDGNHDDGDPALGDSCDADCTAVECGDSYANHAAGEECDEGKRCSDGSSCFIDLDCDPPGCSPRDSGTCTSGCKRPPMYSSSSSSTSPTSSSSDAGSSVSVPYIDFPQDVLQGGSSSS